MNVKKWLAKIKGNGTVLFYWQKIALTIFLFTVIPLGIVGYFYYNNIWKTRVDEVLNTYEIQLKNGCNNINAIYSKLIDRSISVSSNFQLQQFLTESPNFDFSTQFQKYNAMKSFMDLIVRENDRDSVHIYSDLSKPLDGGEYFRELESISEKERIKIISSTKRFYWKYESSKGKRNIFLYRKFLYANNSYAILEFNIPFTKIGGLLNFEIPKESELIYVSHNNVKMIIKGNVEGKKFNIKDFYSITSIIENNRDKLILLIPKKYVENQMLGFNIFFISVLVAIVFVIFFSVITTSKFLTRKLKKLMTDVANDIESAKGVEIDFDTKKEDEFSQINTNFFILIEKIKLYYEEISALELSKKAFELQLLQERINPHFLYNSLSTIKRVFPDLRLEIVINSLVKYYRMSLNKGNEILKLSEEVEIIKQYLLIQKFAYNSDFLFQTEIDVNTSQCKIPKHLIQPIAENAFLHGIMALETGGVISISSKIEGENIIIKVTDNGPGMQSEVLEMLEKEVKSEFGSGYGLKNIKERINLYFGKVYGVTIKSSENTGTEVSIKIPCNI